MNQNIIEKAKILKEKRAVLKGKIKLTEHSEKYQTDILLLDLKETVAIIKREDFDLRDSQRSLVPYVGATVKFVITEIEEDGTLICSRKIAKEISRDRVVSYLEQGNKVEAKIHKLQKFGAYLSINGTIVLLRNVDFSIDHTSVSDVYKEGDTINVKLSKITKSNRIFVEAVEKYCSPTSVDFSTFSPQQVVCGRIRTLKTWGCYVAIAPNVDVLTSVPEYLGEVEEGMNVSVKLSKVDVENQKIRGKIVRIIDNDNDLDM